MTLWRIVLPYATCGLVVDGGGRVVEAAPIVRWAHGLRIADVVRWVRRRGGTIERVSA